ncbi:DUF6398 domain-containing protein [Raineya orbicola]|jgi:hypothetical protein|uniref:DUF6398 domain-containing protein n=1 Tax=Raineya orbicola TaxID=2016530 RepID=A0A2N3IKW4_9BACT|nr:DUF6398 domain-containing protein [Raineya orbicola]PKQ70962.1 hypothetical protein Rain11_0103 [Raineya orbicola]
MDKQQIKAKKQAILDLIRDFCAKKLDEEYMELAEKVLQKLGRKRKVPFTTGKSEVWAAGIINALGTINFLFDKSFEPYVSLDEINNYFGTSKSTTASKSRQIRDMLNLNHFSDEFLTQRIKELNPFTNLVMVDGFIVPLQMLPEEHQKIVKEARAMGMDISFTTTPEPESEE